MQSEYVKNTEIWQKYIINSSNDKIMRIKMIKNLQTLTNTLWQKNIIKFDIFK